MTLFRYELSTTAGVLNTHTPRVPYCVVTTIHKRDRVMEEGRKRREKERRGGGRVGKGRKRRRENGERVRERKEVRERGREGKR